jgi:hypothetical protein
MKLRVLLVGLAAMLSVSAAIAASPPGKGTPLPRVRDASRR